jgi:hypothetical protein
LPPIMNFHSQEVIQPAIHQVDHGIPNWDASQLCTATNQLLNNSLTGQPAGRTSPTATDHDQHALQRKELSKCH